MVTELIVIWPLSPYVRLKFITDNFLHSQFNVRIFIRNIAPCHTSVNTPPPFQELLFVNYSQDRVGPKSCIVDSALGNKQSSQKSTQTQSG